MRDLARLMQQSEDQQCVNEQRHHAMPWSTTSLQINDSTFRCDVLCVFSSLAYGQTYHMAGRRLCEFQSFEMF